VSKLKEGRDEVILEPELPIIDSHHHLFERPQVKYLFEDYLDDVNAGHNIIASIYVETQFMSRMRGPEIFKPLGELEYACGIGAMSDSGKFGKCRIAAAIVVHANLDLGDPVAEMLDIALEMSPERLRGVRQIAMYHQDPSALRFLGTPPTKDLLKSKTFQAGLGHLSKRGLLFNATVFHHQLGELCEVADANPHLTIVLSHLGLALAMDAGQSERPDIFKTWEIELRKLAKRPNVLCKIGGLGTAYWGFEFSTRVKPAHSLELADAWRPMIEVAIDAFGVDRCMMESDYPADGRSCGFVPLWNALKLVTKNYSADEKIALYSGTAAKTYRLEIPSL